MDKNPDERRDSSVINMMSSISSSKDLVQQPLCSNVEIVPYVSGDEAALLRENSRKFNLDLGRPRELFSAVKAIDLLLKLGAAQYFGFKGINTSFVYEENGDLANVLDSHSAIFRDKNLSLRLKNQLMRFFKLIQQHLGDNQDEEISEEDLVSLFDNFVYQLFNQMLLIGDLAKVHRTICMISNALRISPTKHDTLWFLGNAHTSYAFLTPYISEVQEIINMCDYVVCQNVPVVPILGPCDLVKIHVQQPFDIILESDVKQLFGAMPKKGRINVTWHLEFEFCDIDCKASTCLAGDSAAYQRTTAFGDDVVIVAAYRTALCKSKSGGIGPKKAEIMCTPSCKGSSKAKIVHIDIDSTEIRKNEQPLCLLILVSFVQFLSWFQVGIG